MVTGSFPPNVCGVGDYSKVLSDNLSLYGISVDTYNTSALGWSKLFKHGYLKNYDLVHMQYPTVGFGKSMLPHLFILLCKKNNVVTLHEFSQVNVLRRLSILLFKFSKNTSFIFTNEFESNQFKPNEHKSKIIPIGSNIPVSKSTLPKLNQVINFGLIRPDKGIETFIEFVVLCREKNINNYEFIIAGMVDTRFEIFFKEVEQACKDLKIKLILNLNDTEIADLLKQSKYAYLPFPDGASDRRGSMFAAMANECSILTTQGEHTSSNLAGCVTYTKSASDALSQLEKLDQSNNESIHDKLISNSLQYIQRFNWTDISKNHKRFYLEILGNK